MKDSFKALFISPAGSAYGSERSMLALLRNRHFEAEVVCPSGGALEDELQHLGIKVHPLEFGRYSLRQNPLWHLGFYRRFRQILKASQPNAVAINLDGNTPLVTLAAAHAAIPLIRFCRFEFQPPTRWLDRWCWLQAGAIICPSDLVKKQVLDWAPSSFHSRVHRFYEAYTGREAPAHEVTAFRQQLGLGENRVIGCVGRLHPGKRIEVAIRALGDVRKRLGDVRLLVIGEHDGSGAGEAYEKELRELAKDLGVADAVIFAGYFSADQMPAALAACSVCVLPSQSESFGMVLMEAWAQCVPTVASDIGGCGEISRASGGGAVAPVGDVQAFALVMLELLTNPLAASQYGQNGKAWVDKQCSPGSYAARFELVLKSSISIQ
jgi:glycosyltransferase involved in cell wall biosynthesis